VGTHSYADVCQICGGNSNVNKSTRPPYTSEECYDCGWWETDQEEYEGSGFMTLDEINTLRGSATHGRFRFSEMDELTHDELVATRIRIKGPIPSPMEAPYDEYASVINRKPASRDP